METFQPANGPFLEFRKKFFPATQNSSSAETFSSEKCVIYYLCLFYYLFFFCYLFLDPPGGYVETKKVLHTLRERRVFVGAGSGIRTLLGRQGAQPTRASLHFRAYQITETNVSMIRINVSARYIPVMGIKLKTTLTKVGFSLRCVIPKPVCDQLQLGEGDQLTVDLQGHRIILAKLKTQ